MGAWSKNLLQVISVGPGEMKVTNDMNACLASKSLGSCLAVAVYDAEAHVGGLLCTVLPDMEFDPEMALQNPSLFATSGIPQLYRRCYKHGAKKERMECYLIGGADVFDESGSYCPGRENYEKALEVLENNGVTVKAEFVGGVENRRVRLYAGDGKVVICNNRGEELEP